MANLCFYELFAKGTKESVDKFALMMKWEARPAIVSSMYCSDMDVSDPVRNDDGSVTQRFSSVTRWSVKHGMIQREDTDECICLVSAAKRLSLLIEIWSSEPACSFAEHITIYPAGYYDIECEDYHELSAEDILEEYPSPSGELTEDLLVDYLEPILTKGQIDALDIPAICASLIVNERVSIGGFEQNSDFPFNNIPGRVIEGEKE